MRADYPQVRAVMRRLPGVASEISAAEAVDPGEIAFALPGGELAGAANRVAVAVREIHSVLAGRIRAFELAGNTTAAALVGTDSDFAALLAAVLPESGER